MKVWFSRQSIRCQAFVTWFSTALDLGLSSQCQKEMGHGGYCRHSTIGGGIMDVFPGLTNVRYSDHSLTEDQLRKLTGGEWKRDITVRGKFDPI